MKPLVSEEVVIFGGLTSEKGTTMEKSLESEPLEFEAWTTKEDAPGVEGAPEIEPKEERERPGGRSPLVRVQVMGVSARAAREAL